MATTLKGYALPPWETRYIEARFDETVWTYGKTGTLLLFYDASLGAAPTTPALDLRVAYRDGNSNSLASPSGSRFNEGIARSISSASGGFDHLIIRYYPGGWGNTTEWVVVAIWYPAGHPDAPKATPRSAGPIAESAVGGPVSVDPSLPITDVTPGGPYKGSPYDQAKDAAERLGGDLRDYGLGEWVIEPAIPAPTAPVLVVAVADNLVTADSRVDVDTSGHAQQVILTYQRPRVSPPDDPPGTVYADGTTAGWTADVVVTSSPSHGPHTTYVERGALEVTPAVAQSTVDLMGRKAWLRGRVVDVSCPAAWWVRPTHTVRVILPDGTQQDLWVATVRHDARSATSRMGLRAFNLVDYPAD